MSVQTPSGPRKCGMPMYMRMTQDQIRPGLLYPYKQQKKIKKIGKTDSDTPADVSIPSPVNAMKCLMRRICSTSAFALRSASLEDSWRSSFAAILGAVLAIALNSREFI